MPARPEGIEPAWKARPLLRRSEPRNVPEGRSTSSAKVGAPDADSSARRHHLQIGAGLAGLMVEVGRGEVELVDLPRLPGQLSLYHWTLGNLFATLSEPSE